MPFVAGVKVVDAMNVTVTLHSTKKYRGRRRIDRLLLLPYIFLVLVIFSRYCASLKFSDSGAFWSRRNNGGRNNACFRRRNECSVETVASMKTTSQCSASTVPLHSSYQDDQAICSESLFPTHRPLLAIITETDACDTEEKMKHTYDTVKKATSTGKVDLVSVRLSLPPSRDETGAENQLHNQILERASRLTKDLVALSDQQKLDQQSKTQENDENDDDQSDSQSESSFVVVCSSDLVSVAVQARAHGVHVKEHHLDQLSDIVRKFEYPIVIGTSTHSVESALGSYFGTHDDSENSYRPRPHYYFVGTCYLTASHPEKTLQSQLEGPALPGAVQRALRNGLESSQLGASTPIGSLPRIMAIGGIDETNCHEPVGLGADGVAVIRAVLQADHPIERVQDMQAAMLESYAKRE